MIYRNSLDTGTPQGLQDKVFMGFMIFFCNRGRENLREIKKSDFIFDENGQFIEMRDMITKNHKGDIIGVGSGAAGAALAAPIFG